MTDPWIGDTDYAAFSRPKLADLLASVGLDVAYTKARGAYLYVRDGEGTDAPVLDLVGGFGAGLLGHNNAELKELMRSSLDDDVPFLAQVSERREAGRLAEQINRALPGETKYLCHLTNSGTEAVEAALKHAYKVRFDQLRRRFDHVAREIEAFVHLAEQYYPDIVIPGDDRDLGKFRDDVDEYNLAQFESFQRNPVVLALKGSFHGKTATALKVTFNKSYREGFEGLSAVRPEFIDFTDIDRLEEVEQAHRVAFLLPKIEDGAIVLDRISCSTIIAFCLEVIQGEGGIRVLPDAVLESLAAQHARLDIPYLVDEIQTGCGRTGSFVAYADGPLGTIDPEYIVLSKALGGGLVKVGAALIRDDIYDQNFGVLHTSTFAEDELGSRVATRVVDILTRDDNRFMKDVGAKGEYFLSGLRTLQKRFPDVIRDVRGRGLMIGIEFGDLEDKSPLFRFGVRQGFLSLLVASYLLYHHRIRVLAPITTLLKGNPGRRRLCILRIQPTADIGRGEIDGVLRALGEVLTAIAHNNERILIGHLVGVPPSASERAAPTRMPVSRGASTRRVDFDARVGFVVHPARIDHVLAYYFPSLDGVVDRRTLSTWWNRLGRFLEPDVIHTDYIRSDGFVVEANIVSVPYLPRYLIDIYGKAGRARRPARLDALRLEEARDKIQDAVTTAKELGDDHIPTSIVGLGAFTSIVTDRGKTVNDYEVPVTSGNAYTAGLMVQGIVKAAGVKQITLPEATAAVVGAAGNIGSVLAALLAGHVRNLRLIGRPGDDAEERLRETRLMCLRYISRKARDQVRATGTLDGIRIGGLANRILHEIVLPSLANKTESGAWRGVERWLYGREVTRPELGNLLEGGLDRHGGMEGNDYISIHTSVEAVRDCDIVTVATSSAEARLITPDLVRRGSIVSCASVPSNLSSAFKDRLEDYLVFDGGYARLPEGQAIDCVGLPADGLAYGCFSETVLLGFDGHSRSFARGPIKPAQVERTLQMAEWYGFELGDFKLNETPYPADLLARGGNGIKGVGS